MKYLVDTSVIVEIDRQNQEVIKTLTKLLEKGHELIISTITVAEILTGAYLRKDAKIAALTAREVLNQFVWNDIDGITADVTAKLYAQLMIEKKHHSIEFADVLIAATCISNHCDKLMTLNKKDFSLIPSISIVSPNEIR